MMSKITIVHNEHITVEYLTDKKIIHHTVHQPVGGTIFRDALNAGTDALIKYGAVKWLSDDRLNGPVPQDVVDWGFNDWNLRTIKGGWKYWAVVVPQEILNAGSLTPVIDNLYSLGLRMMVFTDLDEAFKWLDKMS